MKKEEGETPTVSATLCSGVVERIPKIIHVGPMPDVWSLLLSIEALPIIFSE